MVTLNKSIEDEVVSLRENLSIFYTQISIFEHNIYGKISTEKENEVLGITEKISSKIVDIFSLIGQIRIELETEKGIKNETR